MILVAEDEVVVRNLTRHVLEADGHEVLAAADGAEALTISRHYQGKIDLLITDVLMPNMNGFELVRQIQQERPDLRILIMSGRSIDTERITIPFLPKPFTPFTLREKVRALLPDDSQPARFH